MSKYNKAIVAAVSLLGTLGASFGFSLSPELQAALVTVVTTALVFFVPNAEA